MTHLPLVSIALCTYNGELYLEEQLKTILNQSYANLEIIAADDGSSDCTVAILHQYAAADTRLKVIVNNQNLGYVKNFEKAIHICTGNYIALADQDDIWELNKIELLVQKIGDAVLVYHDSEMVGSSGKSYGLISGVMNMYEGDSPLPFLFYNCISGHSCMFKRELVPALGTFNNNFYHDWWIAYVAANFGKVAYVDKPLVKYRQHQLSNTDLLRMKEKISRSGTKYTELNIGWLKNCLRIQGKHNELIKQIITLNERKTMINNLKLLFLLLSHFHSLFYLKKKTVFNKLNYIRKMVLFQQTDSH